MVFVVVVVILGEGEEDGGGSHSQLILFNTSPSRHSFSSGHGVGEGVIDGGGIVTGLGEGANGYSQCSHG